MGLVIILPNLIVRCRAIIEPKYSDQFPVMVGNFEICIKLAIRGRPPVLTRLEIHLVVVITATEFIA